MKPKLLRRVVFVIGFFCLAFSCFAAGPLLFKKVLSGEAIWSYLVRLPEDYSKDKKHVLCIVVHWRTGTADEQIHQWEFLASKSGYVLLSPQFEEGYQELVHGEDERLIRMISEAQKEFSVDPDRIFLVGYSGGAEFVHRFALKHPQYAKAACVIGGENYVMLPGPKAGRVRYYVAVGKKDDRRQATLFFYQRLKKKGYDVSFQDYPSVGHELNASIREMVVRFLKDVENIK